MEYILHKLPVSAGFHLLDYHASLAGTQLAWASFDTEEI